MASPTFGPEDRCNVGIVSNRFILRENKVGNEQAKCKDGSPSNENVITHLVFFRTCQIAVSVIEKELGGIEQSPEDIFVDFAVLFIPSYKA